MLPPMMITAPAATLARRIASSASDHGPSLHRADYQSIFPPLAMQRLIAAAHWVPQTRDL
jgi:hypothetical protein